MNKAKANQDDVRGFDQQDFRNKMVQNTHIMLGNLEDGSFK